MDVSCFYVVKWFVLRSKSRIMNWLCKCVCVRVCLCLNRPGEDSLVHREEASEGDLISKNEAQIDFREWISGRTFVSD